MWFFKKKKKEKVEKVTEKKEELKKEAPKKEEHKVVEEKKIEPKKAETKKAEPKKDEPVKEKSVKKETADKPAKEKKATYHITKREDGKWQVKGVGLQKATKLFDTQKEAIEYSKELSKNTDRGFVVHKTDGKIRKKNY